VGKQHGAGHYERLRGLMWNMSTGWHVFTRRDREQERETEEKRRHDQR